MKPVPTALLLLGLTTTILAQSGPPDIREFAAEGTEVTIVPGAHYKAGGFHRFFFGELWRDLWTAEVTVPALDLTRLTPLRRGGGFQTKSLRFRGPNGIQYKFRSLDKDPTKVLPGELRSSLVADILQDLISTANPGGAFIAAPILNAAGVLNAEPALVVIPDDPALGEFREEFGGLLGTLEIHPDEGEENGSGFGNADKIVGTYNLFDRLTRENDELVDANAFLTARLLDIYLGDWDRHVDQWRWAGYKQGDRRYWYPIPRDRDQALCRYNGLIPWGATIAITQIESCDEDYPKIEDLTWSGRYLDRKLLVPVTRREWDSVTVFLESILTDSLLEYAVRRMPKEFYEIAGEDALAVLKARRDGFREASETYYRQIAKYPDIYGTNDREYVEIDRLNDQDVRVTMYKLGKKTGAIEGPPLFRRTFTTDETCEIRIYLRDDDDKTVVRGTVNNSILVRVDGGDGADDFSDSSLVKGHLFGLIPFIPDAETSTRFYDGGKKASFREGPSTSVDRSDYPLPVNDTLLYEPPVRDYGHDWRAATWLNWTPDEGALIGGGPILYEFGFRATPYVYRMELIAAYATGAQTFKAEFNGDFYTVIDGARLSLLLRGSGLEVLNFFGYGNDTPFDEKLEDEDFYMVEQKEYLIEPDVSFPLSHALTASLGTFGKYALTEPDENSLLDSLAPYGIEDFGLAGIRGRLTFDTRNSTDFTTDGLYGTIAGSVTPELLDNQETFSRLEADLRGYISWDLITPSTLALRLFGQKLYGAFPFFEAARLGGSETVRGYSENRFAGDALAGSNAELRMHLARFNVLVPGTIGILAFGDAGRVFLDRESSSTIHTAYGGGLWMTFVEPANLMSISVARSEEELAFYLGFGFMY